MRRTRDLGKVGGKVVAGGASSSPRYAMCWRVEHCISQTSPGEGGGEEKEREGEEEGRSPGTGAALGRTYVWNASVGFVRSGAARRSLNRKQWLQLLCK